MSLTHTVTIACDYPHPRCATTFGPKSVVPSAARAEAREAGWYVGEADKSYCPEHKAALGLRTASRDVTGASRIVGFPAHRGAIATDGYYARGFVVARCSVSGCVDVVPVMAEYVGAERRAYTRIPAPPPPEVVAKARWPYAFAAWLAALWGGR